MSESTNIKAYAKLNLFLDVRETRQDGLHDLVAVNHEVTLHDSLLFRFGGEGLRLKIRGNPDVPDDDENLVAKAVRSLIPEEKVCMEIELDKRIPVGAGLGGGSADAAMTLKVINEEYELDLSEEELLTKAATIGADVPFSLLGGTARVTGAGENLEPLPDSQDPFWFVIADPGVSVNTCEAYALLDARGSRQNGNPEALIDALAACDTNALAECLHNSFEETIFGKFPAIRELRDEILQAGAIGAGMTGSGSNVFGVVCSQKHAEQISLRITDKCWGCWAVRSARFLSR